MINIGVDINKYLDDKYLSKFNKEIETSTERASLFAAMQSDKIIQNYLSSNHYRSKQVKKKNSFLTEQDTTLKKIEYIADYILQPDHKEYNIKSRDQLREVGRIKCKKTGKRKSFNRTVYLESIVNKINSKNSSDDSEYVSGEDFAAWIVNLPDISELWSYFDFSNPKHVKTLLVNYHKVIPEIEDRPDTRQWSMVVLLNELINNTQFSNIDRKILHYVQSGLYGYNQIKKMINNEFNKNYTYRSIEWKISRSIPLKITKNYEKQVKKVVKFENT